MAFRRFRPRSMNRRFRRSGRGAWVTDMFSQTLDPLPSATPRNATVLSLCEADDWMPAAQIANKPASLLSTHIDMNFGLRPLATGGGAQTTQIFLRWALCVADQEDLDTTAPGLMLGSATAGDFLQGGVQRLLRVGQQSAFIRSPGSFAFGDGGVIPGLRFVIRWRGRQRMTRDTALLLAAVCYFPTGDLTSLVQMNWDVLSRTYIRV